MTDIKSYNVKLLLEAANGTTTRHILVEADAYGALHRVDVYEFRPPKVKMDHTHGNEWHRVTLDWYITVEEAIDAAEEAFQSSLSAGFHELIADTTAGY